jgi:hypothetical protein
MKRLFWILGTATILGAGIACFNKGNEPAVELSRPKVSEPFTTNYEFDEKALPFFVDNDTTGNIYGSSPFYFGKQPLPFAEGLEYEKVRAAKVEEIKAVAKQIVDEASAGEADAQTAIDALCAYLQVVIKLEPKAEKSVKTALASIAKSRSKQRIDIALYEGLAKQNADNAFAQSMVDYYAVVKAIEVGDSAMTLSLQVATIAAGFYEATKDSPVAAVKEAAAKLDADMAIMDSVMERNRKVLGGMAGVRQGLRQLKAADVRYAKAALAYMAQEIPKIRETLKSVQPNENLPKEILEMSKQHLAYWDGFQKGLSASLDKIPEENLAPVPKAPQAVSLIPDAYASTRSHYEDAYGTASQKINTGWTFGGMLESGWNGVKAVGSGVKTAVHGIQTGIGVGLDTVDAIVQAPIRIGYDIYTRNTMDSLAGKKLTDKYPRFNDRIDNEFKNDTVREIESDFRQIGKNFDECKSGSEILVTTKRFLDYGEEVISQTAESAAKSQFGEGWTSKGVGLVSKLGAGILTGLGKGAALIGNRQASGSDYVMGGLEFVGVALGGSKMLVKGTQLPQVAKGAGEVGWLGAQRVWGSVRNWATADLRSDIAAGVKHLRSKIAEATKAGMKEEAEQLTRQLASLSVDVAAEQAFKRATKQAIAEIGVKFKDIIAATGAAMKANANTTMRESLKEFMDGILRRNIQEATEEISKTFGQKAAAAVGGAIDELFAEGMDDLIKGLVEEAMAESPTADEMNGTWRGSVTITSVTIPPGAQSKNKDCDFAGALKEMQGKTVPAELSVKIGNSGFGSGTFKMGKAGDNWSVPVEIDYREGALSATGGVKEGSMSLNGNANRADKGYGMAGKARLSGTGKSAGFAISMSLKLSK